MPASAWSRPTSSRGDPGRRGRSTPCSTWPARPRPPTTWPCRSRRWPWAARAPATASSWPTGHGARFLLASTSEVYGDPDVHPQTEAYWGNVNPVGPRSVYDEAKRFAEALTMAYHRTLRHRRGDRPHLQHLRAPAAARRRPGGVQLPLQALRRRAAHRLRGRQPDPEPLLRGRRGAGLLALLDSGSHRPGQHRQPRRVHHARAGPDRDRADRLARPRSSTARSRSTTPPAGARTSPWPGGTGLGADHRPARTAWPGRPPSWPRRPAAERSPHRPTADGRPTRCRPVRERARPLRAERDRVQETGR